MKLIQNMEELEKIGSFKDRKGKQYIGYYRMGYRNGWFGIWLDRVVERLEPQENELLSMVEELIEEMFPKGADWQMEEKLKRQYFPSPNGRYYLFADRTNYNVLIELNTEYGNADYPCRLYYYRDMEKNLGEDNTDENFSEDSRNEQGAVA